MAPDMKEKLNIPFNNKLGFREVQSHCPNPQPYIYQMGLTYIYRTLHQNTKEYIVLSPSYKTFSKTDHINLLTKQTSIDTKILE